ncbi:hypothetical protein [Streptomyces sp. NPDC056683]|uniref:hypothetical protein n=1 Tax=Streptomyces sp. NPDC056683 TaxID=3345910 RepID=UPI0036A1B57F
MPGTDTTPPAYIADYALEMAADIERYGIWTAGPNFVDPASERLDVPAAAYKATTGALPFIFAIPDADAADTARAYIEAAPAAMDTLRALAAYLATVRPDADWTDDPIDRLANWPHLLGVDPAGIPQTLRDFAHSLTTDAPAPAAA